MSLRVWLPLTKDLRNQGLDDVTVTNNGATFDVNGKLGGCYSFDGSTSSINTNINIPNFALDKTYSITCWVCPSGISGQKPIIGIGPDWSWTIFQQDTDLRFVQWDGSGSRWGDPAISGVFSVNTWVHIGVVWNQGILLFYKNGKKIYEWTAPTSRTIKVSSDTVKIGGNIYAWGNNYFNGKLNDVRIYDHALSPLEIKQISQGLILHYPLNRNGWGNENLLVDTYNWSTLTGTSTVSEGYWYSNGGTAVRGYDNINNITYCKIWHSDSSSWTRYSRQYITMQPNTYYTVSILCRINTDIAHLSIRNDRKEAITPFAVNVELTNKNWEWKFFTAKTHTNTSQEPFVIYAQVNSDGVLSSDTSIDIAKIKLEKGSVATPWCPNSTDALATTMGLNDNVEYDTSGYGNNGTRMGTFSWTSNTPKYTVSQVFNGTNNAIQTPSLPSMISDKNYTIAVWTYKTVIGTKSCQTIYGGPGGFELEARSSSSTSPLYRIHNWGGGTTAYNFGEWTHFCFVHTDLDSKLYVNGELKITGTSANIPSGDYFIGAWKTSTRQNYEGLMSDFRIYATALSADDVKSLYQNSAYIDNQSNIYGAVYEEG